MFSHFSHVQHSIMIRFPMCVSYRFKFPKLPISLSDVHIPRIRIFSCFSSFRSFANCQLMSVDSCNWHLLPTNCLSQHTFWFSTCRRRRCLCRSRRRCFCRRRCIRRAASANATIIHSAAAILVIRSCCLQPPRLSTVSVSHCCLCCRLHCYPWSPPVVV